MPTKISQKNRERGNQSHGLSGRTQTTKHMENVLELQADPLQLLLLLSGAFYMAYIKICKQPGRASDRNHMQIIYNFNFFVANKTTRKLTNISAEHLRKTGKFGQESAPNSHHLFDGSKTLKVQPQTKTKKRACI